MVKTSFLLTIFSIFQHFATPEEARYAMQSLSGRMFKGKRLKVELSTTPVKRTSTNGGSDVSGSCAAIDFIILLLLSYINIIIVIIIIIKSMGAAFYNKEPWQLEARDAAVIS